MGRMDSSGGNGKPVARGASLGECLAAARIAECAGDGGRAKVFRERGGEVRHALERMEAPDGYRTIDRVTHASPAGKKLWEGGAGEELKGSVSLRQPARLLLRCAGSQETRPLIRVAVEGKNAEGDGVPGGFPQRAFFLASRNGDVLQPDGLDADYFHPRGGSCGGGDDVLARDSGSCARGSFAFSPAVEPRGLRPRARKKCSPGSARARNTHSPCGLRFVPRSDPAAGNTAAGGVWMFWNMLMGEAAIRYGRGDLAYAWTGKWMHALAGALRADRSFRSCYDPERAAGSGPRNSLQGIFPVGFFLAALGVHPVASNRVWAGGRSIFPFPVTIRWRGMTIRREGESVQVEFPSGAKREFHGTERTLITDED